MSQARDNALPPRVDGGYLPLRDYTALGDGRTVALVGADGAVDWLPLPALDSPPVFAALLDPASGGRLELRPDPETHGDDVTVTRCYVEDTNVLETTFRTGTGEVRVTDALTVGVAGRLPWGELARRVDGVSGEVTMRWRVAPGDRFGSAAPWAESRCGGLLLNAGDQHLAVRAFGVGEPQLQEREVSGRFVARAGERGLLALVSSDREPVFLPGRRDVDRRIDRTVESWQRWAGDIGYSGPWARQVRRSALALKLLLYSPTGAIAAAPTTSLPEQLGGDRNYDYRFAWIRDSSFTIDALIALGISEEVHGAISWLLSTISRTAPDLHVFYTLGGDVPGAQTTLDAPGYRGSAPVHSGNSAAGQTQLGTYGDLFDSVWLYVREGHVLDEHTALLLAELADRTCDQWQQRDAGIWELHDPQHYTISKIGCWVALDRAIQLADSGQLVSLHVERWRHERARIQAWVNTHCWSAEKNAWTFYAGTDDLDASVLLAGRTGFSADAPERLAGTIDAVRRELGCGGPLLYRYSGQQGKEGAFVACSFWLADACVHADRLDEARDTIEQMLALATPTGLYAEEIDPDNHEMLGNYPQGLSHLALINAVATYARATGGGVPGPGE